MNGVQARQYRRGKLLKSFVEARFSIIIADSYVSVARKAGIASLLFSYFFQLTWTSIGYTTQRYTAQVHTAYPCAVL